MEKAIATTKHRNNRLSISAAISFETLFFSCIAILPGATL